MFEVLKQIWELPWYQVLIIAAADDAILLVKIWPVCVLLIVLSILGAINKIMRG